MGSCPLSPWSRAGVLLTWLSAQVPSPRYSYWWRLIMTRGYLACWTSACIPCLIQEQMTSKCSPVFLLSSIPPTWTRLCLFLSHWPVVDHIKFLKYDLGSSSWCHRTRQVCALCIGEGEELCPQKEPHKSSLPTLSPCYILHLIEVSWNYGTGCQRSPFKTLRSGMGSCFSMRHLLYLGIPAETLNLTTSLRKKKKRQCLLLRSLEENKGDTHV